MSQKPFHFPVAIIGAGNMAREHIRAFINIPGITVDGIYSRTRDRAAMLAAEYEIPKVCNSIPELYEATKAKLVVITVPELQMASVSKACFEFSWTALLEKPPGLNLIQALDIYKSAESAGSHVLVALNRRFMSSTRAALEDLSNNSHRRFIHVQDQEDQTKAKESGQPEEVVNNWMYANSIHIIDYLLTFGRGKVKTVTPISPWNPDNPGIVLSRIEFESGDIGLYEGIWNGPAPWGVTISTPEKRWEMRPLEQAAYQLSGERILNEVQLHYWDREFKPGFRLQAEMAVAAALGNPSQAVTLQDSIETMKLIEDIFTVTQIKP